MFSGIIKHTGVIVELESAADQAKLVTQSELFADAAEPVIYGESIAHSGVCLTVVAVQGNRATFDISSETLRRTTFDGARPGTLVNLERSLAMGERIHGHFVQGHVEEVGSVVSESTEGQTKKLRIQFPKTMSPFLAEKGSVAVDGVSLTIGEIVDDTFAVYVIPATIALTTLAHAVSGSRVNLESDCLARYAAQAVLAMQNRRI